LTEWGAATTGLPIVAIAVGAPVLTGLVSNIARPGGNITGSTIFGTEVAPKRLELAKELRPSATLIVLLLNPDNPANVELERELRFAAPRQGLKLVSVRARHVDDFKRRREPWRSSG
jgi:putative ABC transport system substrate-binding protein